jgi:hypothetical protein
MAALNASVAAAREVRELCDALQASARTAEFIQARKSPTDVRKALAEARAAEADKTEIQNTPKPRQADTPPADFNPSTLLAEVLEMKKQAVEARSKK